MRTRVVTSLLCALALTDRASADEVSREPVEIQVTSHDIVGQRLALALRERLARSSLMRPWKPSPESDGVRFILRIVTIENTGAAKGDATVYSAVWTFLPGPILRNDELFATSMVGFVGAQRVAEMAEMLLAKTYEVMAEPQFKMTTEDARCLLECRVRQGGGGHATAPQ